MTHTPSTQGLASGAASVSERRYEAWGFDGCRKLAGRDHAVDLEDRTRTLCGLNVNPNGWPTGEWFDPTLNYACRNCRRAFNVASGAARGGS